MDLISNLIEAGFTEYEAKVYLVLLSEHPATGYQLSKKAGIPRSMVYEALGRLHARGAVLKTEEQRATLFRPVPPDTLFDRFEQEHRNLIQDLRSGLRKLHNAQDEDRLWSISGFGSVISYAAKMMQNAQNEIMVVISDSELEALREEILNRCKRGVRVNVLLTGEGSLSTGPEDLSAADRAVLHVTRHPPVESQLQELNHMLLVTIDNHECLIAKLDPDAGSMTATITNNRQLVFIARQFVWMELFTQRIYAQIGPELLELLSPEDQQIFANFPPIKTNAKVASISPTSGR